MKHLFLRAFIWGISLLGLLLVVAGCSLQTSPIADPKGPIALMERDLLYTAFFIMLIVVIPVFIMVFWFAWRYRAKGGSGEYKPEWSKSRTIEVFVWSIPTVIIIALGYLVWTYSHLLDPYKKIAAPENTINVQVIAQDWKWLFIYPELGIASVNELAFPADKAISLKLTSDTVMNSFLIPALGGQIYAMAGMTTQLNLQANEPGRFRGRNTQYSGDGYSMQFFDAVAMTTQEFEDWVANVKAQSKPLSTVTYNELAKPSIEHDVEFFSWVKPGLFEEVLKKYARRPAPTLRRHTPPPTQTNCEGNKPC
ncbi:Cytochrome bo(3) ubiquinol oxidase subunit 2 precursor [Pseudovibrio axinellae]|uniref:Ubiquinol oxidase subunit 2 n=1 Tax=Pseudovibrio axinellae TaxID=989403 RepID=A0A165VSL1_9HYPH|nr:ubiquinol oxidase subunit II [Pseudovibrio axinellae]KZL15382.1 Cytochrome bo(3) ubiquinol oxidase subunit 2 precursor [Pseudovibrio axinellae]SER54096.1 cytochrome bo3 quinol oxidase subunit 2 [Pseudovibrio axinellae]